MDSGERVWRERGLRSAVLAGDERAWRTWYEESYAGLYAYVCWRCGGCRDRTDEAVQDTWLTAVRRVRSFDPDRGPFAAWLRGIAANVLRNQFREHRLRVRQLQPLAADHAVPSQAAAAVEDRDRAEGIARALAALPPRYEAVLQAKYLEQKSVAAIAADWNETPKAVESLLSRARQAFRAAYAGGEAAAERANL
jgi:RNA polymerase sigma-70 factor (ECF subfamily)